LWVDFSRINRIVSSLPNYSKVRQALDGMSVAQLRQVRDANIRFLSKLALNRLPGG
jgi:hypothetical protein